MVRAVLTVRLRPESVRLLWSIACTNQEVNVGEAIGIIAAQSIGEPVLS